MGPARQAAPRAIGVGVLWQDRPPGTGGFVGGPGKLGVDRKALRRLTWHNPRILNAAHERLELFHIGVKSKIIAAIYSRSAKRRRWGFDAMFDSYEFRDHLFASAWWAAPARRSRDVEAASPSVTFRWADEEIRPPVEAELASPIASPPREPKALPKWEGEYGPPPLVANRYQPGSRRHCRRLGSRNDRGRAVGCLGAAIADLGDDLRLELGVVQFQAQSPQMLNSR